MCVGDEQRGPVHIQGGHVIARYACGNETRESRVKIWFDLLIGSLNGVHLLLVNIASAGPLLAACVEWRRGIDPAEGNRWVRHLLGIALGSLIFGGALGLVVGSFVWSQGLSDVLARMPSKVRFGIVELVFSLVCMIAHLTWAARTTSSGLVARLGRTVLGVLSSTNLLYHFPVLFAVTSELMHQGQQHGPILTASDFRGWLINSSAGVRALHAALAAVALTGIYVCAAACWSGGKTGPSSDTLPGAIQRWVTWGGRWALAATAAQWLVGFWVVLRLTSAASHRLLGEDVLAAPLMLLCVIATFALTHLCAILAQGQASRRHVTITTLLMVTVVLLMSIVSQRLLRPM